MNELALKICKQYIDGLVTAMEATADMRERFKVASKPGFLSDINDTLDMHYDHGGSQKRLLDVFLADVVEAGGHVELYSGLPDQDMRSFELQKAFDRKGEALKITPKPLTDWKQIPPIIFEDQEDLLKVAELRGFVAVDPWDEGLEEFLGSWQTLKESVSDDAWPQQRDQLLAPFVGH